MTGIPVIEPYRLPVADELPSSVARWRPDPNRAVLLVHDMQRYFVRPFPESIKAPLVANISTLRTRCGELGVPVAYTAQPGSMTDEQRGLLKDIWGPGMARSPEEQSVVVPLAPGPADWKFTKLRYSAFFGSDLLERIRSAGRDQLVLCGVYAHVGVLMTAIEAYSNDLETFLVADAIADFTPDDHMMALRYAASQCAVLVTAKDVFP